LAIETKKSYCRICQGFCAIDVDVEDGRILAVRGDRDDPMTGGYTCIKGRQLPEQANHPERLRSSLKRLPDGSLVPISSERAMDEISERLSRIIDEHGPRAVATYNGTSAHYDSAAIEFVKAWHRGIDSPSYYTSLTIDQPSKIIAVARHGVWMGGGHSFATSDVALVVGNNPLVSHLAVPGGLPGFNPFKQLNDARKRGLKLICIDPRRSELARRADLHLQIRPGEDPTLLAGMLRVILEEGLHDAAFCAENVEGLEELREAIRDFTPGYVAARTGVPEAQMIAAARLFGGAERGCVSSGTGPDMAPHPNLSEHLISSLNTICGRCNRVGEKLDNPGVLALAVPRLAQALSPEQVPPNLSYGGGPRSRVRGLQQIFEQMPTPALADEILEPGEGQVRALISVGGNPVVAWPDQRKTLRALDAVELFVCIDFRPTASARRADYVIAAKLPLERDDVPMFTDIWYEQPYSRYVRPVVEAEFDLIEEWEFFWGLARRMKTPIALAGGALDPETDPVKLEVLEKITAGSRVPLAEVYEHEAGHVFDQVQVEVSPAMPGADGRLRLAPEGIVEEIRVVRSEPIPSVGCYGRDGSFTHLLICRRVDHVLNSVCQELPQSRLKGTTNPAYMNHADLDTLGLSPGDLIEVESDHDTIPAVVEPTDEVQSGVISMAHSWGETPERDAEVREIGSNTGRLVATDRDYDPLTGMTRQTAIPVKVRRAEAAC
jgi:anaerobic selenocysteine-containing dehydrogenase